MPSAPERTSNVVRPAAFQRADGELVVAARRGDAGAQAQIFDRHAPHVARVLARILGTERELADLVHDVFVMAFRDLARLSDENALKAWLSAIAVNTARGHIRRRSRRRWLRFFAPEDMPEAPSGAADEETREAVRATYAVLERMDPEERIPFALRFIEGMELTEVASACGVSLATIKRRLGRAEAAFLEGARAHAVLESWISGGARWSES